MEDIISMIKSVAEQDAPYDNEEFSIYESAGGDIDDAFELGCSQGKVNFARKLLKMLDSKDLG